MPLLTGACSRIPSLAELGFAGSSKLDPATLAQALLRWPTHSLVLVPELLRLLLALCSANPALAEQLAGLRFVAVGGGKVSPELISRARKLGLPVYEGYGLSECGSVVALNGPDGHSLGSVGQPLPHCRYRSPQTARSWWRSRHARLSGQRRADASTGRHRRSGPPG